METKEDILDLLGQYLKRFPGEKERVTPLFQFVQQYDGAELINRKNFDGHITTSAFIIDENRNSLLLLKHKSLNRWLQPGGHVDASDPSLVASALREACEETGFGEEQLTLVSNQVFDVDSHRIPENLKKQERAHIHHDIRYLFHCSDVHSLNISLEESTDSKWISFSELEGNADFYWVEEKIKAFT